MVNIAPALHLVSAKLDLLKAVGVDKDEILLTVDGITKTTPAAVASDMTNMVEITHDILTFVAGLESVDALKATCEAIKYVYPK